MSSPAAWETVRAIRFHLIGEFSNQKKAISVWSGVRPVLFRPPSAFISLKSAAYFLLVRS